MNGTIAAGELAALLPKHFYDDTSSQATSSSKKSIEKTYIEKLELLVEKRHLRGCTEEAEERTGWMHRHSRTVRLGDSHIHLL